MYFPKDEMDTSTVVIKNYITTFTSLIIIMLLFLLLQETPNYTIVVLGRGTVGKTSLIFRYINNQCPKEHDPTVEDAYSIQIETDICKGKEFKILDTAGEEDYQNMLDQWISSASGFILVFAINDLETFEALKSKVKRIEKNEADQLPIVLVGNKCDLKDQRKVSEQEAEEFAKTIGAKYFETSSLDDANGNVKVVFQVCGEMILKKTDNKERKKAKCVGCSIF